MNVTSISDGTKIFILFDPNTALAMFKFELNNRQWNTCMQR